MARARAQTDHASHTYYTSFPFSVSRATLCVGCWWGEENACVCRSHALDPHGARMPPVGWVVAEQQPHTRDAGGAPALVEARGLACSCTGPPAPTEQVATQFSKGVIVWASPYGSVLVGPTAEPQLSRADRLSLLLRTRPLNGARDTINGSVRPTPSEYLSMQAVTHIGSVLKLRTGR